jgi:hypothetical protein
MLANGDVEELVREFDAGTTLDPCQVIGNWLQSGGAMLFGHLPCDWQHTVHASDHGYYKGGDDQSVKLITASRGRLKASHRLMTSRRPAP